MPDPTPKAIIEEEIARRLAARPELQKEINAVVVFEITGPAGGTWTLDLSTSPGRVAAGAEGVSPAMTLTAADQDFVGVCTKKLNAQTAAMQGKLRFRPMNINLALKLAKLLA
jgi:hypothetical protein